MTKQIAIGVVLDHHRVLVGRRAVGGPLAGFDEFPGGKLESGESPEQAVVRECLEETGLQVVVDQLLESVDHRYDHSDVRLYFFRCHLASSSDFATSNTPHEPFRWGDARRRDPHGR